MEAFQFCTKVFRHFTRAVGGLIVNDYYFDFADENLTLISSSRCSSLTASLRVRTTTLIFGSLSWSSTNVSRMRWFSNLAVTDLPNGIDFTKSGWSK